MQSIIFPNKEKLYEVGFSDGKQKGSSMLENFNEKNNSILDSDIEKEIKIEKNINLLKNRISKLKNEIDEHNHPRYTEGFYDGLDSVFQEIPELAVNKTK